jgi:membrane-associated phospholipid phosphatase
MRKKFLVVFVLAIAFSGVSYAQQDSLVKKLDSLSKKSDTIRQVNDVNPSTYNETTKINFRNYFVLLGSDFKQQFTTPFHMSKRDWTKLGIFTVGLGALSFGDEPIQKSALRMRNSSSSLREVSHYVTNFGGAYETYVLTGMTVWGWVFKKDKMKTTTLLATHAYITSAVMESMMKLLSGRQRPIYADPNNLGAEPTFHGPLYTGSDVNGQKINSSFPSGHTTVAFAAATVYAMEYKNTWWVPVLSYSAATLIGLSRITENKHWITDVVAGAALGLITGHQVVNNYHRYAKLKATEKLKNSISFNLQYNMGTLQPGIVYKFR